MPDAYPQPTEIWLIVTHLGSASLLLPILAIAAIGCWHSGQRAALRVWLQAFSLAVMITLASKIGFLGWGIGIPSLDFTGISGHTLFATSVLPVLFGWLLAPGRRRFSLAGAAFGLLLATGVGMSRVVLGHHSISEVVIAWLVGLAVSAATLNAMRIPLQRPWFLLLAPLLLLLAFGTSTSNYLPTHVWEVRIALLLSGRDVPYTRQQLKRPAPIAQSAGSEA